ncbi:tetratricopeptide repeat protein [Streptomyces sp. NPDC052069]|uniref:tetratricopeptide repeat protein n=1 Tax=Streptomyces sp. NPDC052069 TaxID=3154650 RepID=UPI0034304569
MEPVPGSGHTAEGGRGGLRGPNIQDNTVSGDATLSGPVVQAHGIHGGVHFHTAPEPAVATARQLLPAPPYFLGRESELGSLREMTGRLPTAPLLAVISGPAGVGKTALASSWLRGMGEQFPDGQFYADLRGHSATGSPAPPAEILAQFLRALGLTQVPQGLGELAALWRTRTAGRRIAVMLDNAVSAGQVRPLLPGTEGSLVAVTSRFRLAGLAVDGAVFQQLGVLDTEDTVELLSRRIGSDRVSREPEAAREVAALCAGLPLAVCVAAARMAVRPRQPLAAMALALGGDGGLDTLKVEGEPAVRAALDASYRLLEPDLALGYRQLGIIPVSVFSVRVAAAACGADPVEADRIVDALAEVNLLEDLGPDPVTGLDRFRFHDLVRAHAGALAEADESPEDRRRTVRRVVDLYLRTATAAEALLSPSHRTLRRDYACDREQPPPFGDATGALEWLDAERTHLMAVLRRAAGLGWDAAVWQLADAMWPLFLRLRPYDLWIEAHEAGLAAARRAGDPQGESRMLTSGGTGLRNVGRHDDAVAWFTRAAEAALRDQDSVAEAQALHGVGQSHRLAGRLTEARSFFVRALALREAAGYRRGAALTELCLGDVELAEGRPERAIGPLSRARAVLLDVRDAYDAARALAHLARAHAGAGDHALAAEELGRALGEFEATGSVHWQGRVLEMLGETAAERGEGAEARGWYEQSLARYASVSADDVRRLEDRLGEAAR